MKNKQLIQKHQIGKTIENIGRSVIGIGKKVLGVLDMIAPSNPGTDPRTSLFSNIKKISWDE